MIIPNTNFVIIESPFKGRDQFEEDIHRQYLKLCILNSIWIYGENPYASHGYLTNYLDDSNYVHRDVGISCGIGYYHLIKKCVVYEDLGMSPGMEKGIEYAVQMNCIITFRSIAHLEGVKQLMEYKNIINESRQEARDRN